ncbi:MAG: NAD-dependent epimerase/dehydratase family protein [Acidobacteria bacterium]|nr:NAD-dependent epimerase/dehydratase family protein [Acidobacteriota bacterium]
MTGQPTLVTGAAGFAGRHLVAHLRATAPERPLLAWVRSQVDITDREAVRNAVAEARPTRIVHLAGSPHVGDSWRSSLLPLQTNVLGTHYLLEAVRQHCPDCRIVVVTSAMIYRTSDAALDEDAPLEPSSPYGLSKLAQDQLALIAARNDGLHVVVARPFNHIGPHQNSSFALSSFARQIALIEAGLVPPEIHVGNLDAERDFTDVRDVADAYARLLDAGQPGRVYNICSDTPHRIADLLNRLIAIAHVPVTLATDPARLRPSDQLRMVGSSARIRTELGWRPKWSIDDTLADLLRWWRAEVVAGRATA